MVHPLTTVERVRPREGGGYEVAVRYTKAKVRRSAVRRTLTAEQVVLAASALGTQRLLHRMRDEGHLPELSARIGHLSRTNSESILGAIAPDTTVDYSQGVAITSSFHPDDETHIEPVRYGKGSNAMSLMQTVLTDGDGPAAVADLAPGDVAREGQRARPLRPAALVGADRDRAGHADRRQLDHHLLEAEPADPRWYLLAPGARHAEPDLDPRREQGGADDGAGHRRQAGRLDRRAVQPAADRALHRRLHDRRVRPDRGDRPLPAGLPLPGLHVADGSAISANLGVNPR